MGRRYFPGLVVIVALLLTLPALWCGRQIDDHFHRFVLLGSPGIPALHAAPTDLFALIDGDPERNHQLMDIGLMPWWTYEGLRIAFWRPLSALTHWLDYQLWPNLPVLMHVHNLLWFALVIVIAGSLYRRLIGPAWMVGLAVLLFAIDDTHALPVGWIANRNALISGAFGLLALLAHDRWRRDGWRWGAGLAPLALLLALLSGEAAVGAGAYLLAYACFLDTAAWRRRLATLLPCAVIGVGWAIAYRTLGYGADGSGPYNDPAQDPLHFITLIAQRAPLLLMGQWGVPSADASSVVSLSALRTLWLWSLFQLGLLAVTFLPLVRRDRTARFFAAGMLLSVLPLCSAFPMDRILFFVGFGAMGLLAQWLGGLRERADWVPKRLAWRVVARPVAVALVAIHAVLAPLVLPFQTWTPALMGIGIERAVDSLPDDPAFANQQLIVVNTPNAFSALYLTILRALDDRPLPTHTRALGPTGQSIELRRVDEYTLVVRPRLGFLPPPGTPTGQRRYPFFDFTYIHQRLEQLFRGADYPMKLGQRVELTGVSIEVTALTDDGRPAEATFRFAVPLEHPSLYWVRGEQDRFVPFTPPAVGDTVYLEPPALWRAD